MDAASPPPRPASPHSSPVDPPPSFASPHSSPVDPPPSFASPLSSSSAPLPRISSPHPSPIAPPPSVASPTASAAAPSPCIAFPHPNPVHPLPSTTYPLSSTAAPPPTLALPHPSPVAPPPSFAAPLSSAVAPPPTSTLIPPSSVAPLTSSTAPPPAISAPPKPAAPVAAAGTMQYKKLLNEYAQRNEIKCPEYRLSKEPAYRAYVLIDGKTFASSRAFSTVKEAQQDVARVALEEMMLKMKQEGCSLLYEDAMLCKSILNEFASKLRLPLPMYEVSPQVGPPFISTALFCGQKYTGERARSKRDAEQMAARAVIQSILGGSDGTTMSEIIKAKRKLHTTIQGIDIPMVSQIKLLGQAQMEVVSHGEGAQLPFSVATQPTQHQIDYSHEPCATEAASIPPCFQQGPLMSNNEPVAEISGKKKRKKKYLERRQKKLLRAEQPVSASDISTPYLETMG